MKPVFFSMLYKAESHNFCRFLALVNLIAFNCGFHVHEKAIMNVTIPLSVTLLAGLNSKKAEKRKTMDIDLHRFVFLKIFVIWTFWPLFHTRNDCSARYWLAGLDLCVFLASV